MRGSSQLASNGRGVGHLSSLAAAFSRATWGMVVTVKCSWYASLEETHNVWTNSAGELPTVHDYRAGCPATRSPLVSIKHIGVLL